VAPEQSQIGPWTTHEKLGEGGNAVVWRASRGDEEVALKVINATKTNREPYRRFVNEIKFLRSLDDLSGVLPLLDAYLPENPSRYDRPWLAMPRATPIARALNGATLETVVDALAAIAETLARLADGRVGHRDVKPGNLYELNGEWLVGDFGLVAAPDLEGVTRHGQPIGPLHYTAHELIADPVNANPLPADVYSLGKTLWVLATGQAFPPDGHQPAGMRGFSILELRPHPHAAALDRLVDLATRLHSDQRPSMGQFADDLRHWRELGQTPTLDVSNLAAKLRAKMARELAAEDVQAQRKELAFVAIRDLQELMRPLHEALAAAHPRPEIDIVGDEFAANTLRTVRAFGAPTIVFDYDRVSRISSGDRPFRLQLTVGRGLELTEDGTLIFRTFVTVGTEKLRRSFARQSEDMRAPVGSVEAQRMIERGVAELAEKLEEALAVFLERVSEPPE
jgi:hypothetical protein